MPVNPFDLTGADYFAGDDMMGLWDLSSGAGDNPFSLMGYDMLGQAVAAAQQAQQGQGLPANIHQLANHPIVRQAIRANAAQAVAVNAAKAQAMKQAMAQQMPGGTDRQREQILPLDSVTNVGAGLSATITAQPQRAFRTERLIVDSASSTASNSGGNISCSFIINNLLVGADPQFLALSGAVPASIFAPNAVGTRLKGTVAVPGIVVSVAVSNIDGADHRFLGAVLGPALD